MTPEKTEVIDPRKLTDKDKKAIDAAIRKAYTVDGESKLPNGTGDRKGVPAVIQIDDSGNVKIFSGNDVAGTWDPENNYEFVPEKNEDGSYKVKDGAKPKITIPAKDLVKNIAPKSPAIAVDTDTGTVTITPPAYENPGDDTDLLSYTITYKDNSGAEKTVTATRNLDTNKWSGPGVNEESGVITLSVEKIELAGTITATAKDNGGHEGDTDKLDSDPATKKLETATVSYDRNGGTGEMDSKKLNKGSKYKILSNAFTAPANEKFKTWKIGETEYTADDEITVKEDTTIKAIWQDIEVKVSYDANGGSGEMTGKTLKKGSKYTLLDNGFTAPENKEFQGWKIGDTEYTEGAEITVDEDTEVKAIWKDIEYKVTFDGNGGSGDMPGKTVKKGSKFRLPPSKFEAPKNKEFKGWKIGDKEYQEGDEITVNRNTTITALWKDKPVPSSTTPGKDKPGKQGKSQPQNPAAGGNLLKTGANGMYSLYASLLLLATGGLFLISRRRRNQR